MLGQANAFFYEPIKIWGVDPTVAEGAEITVTHVVSNYEDEIRL